MSRSKTVLVLFVLLVFSGWLRSQEIFEATKGNDLAKVKALVETDPQWVNAKDETGRTPLHWACRGVHPEVLKYLVGKGANVNALDNNGIAPLHSLASRGHAEGIGYLLVHAADANIRTPQNDTPLHYAAFTGNASVIKLLLEKGAAPSAKNKNGDTPLAYAANGEFKEAVDLLLDKGAEYDATGEKAFDLLLSAAGNGLERLAKVVIGNEGKGLFRDESRSKEIMLEAIKGGSVEIVKLLMANRIPLEKKADRYGWTPIHYAASKGRTAMIGFLVESGIDINARNKSGETAYNIAESKGNKELQDLIIKKGGNAEPRKIPVLEGAYLGQKLPGTTPEIFAPGIVSTSAHEFCCCFSPDGSEFYFTRRDPVINNFVIMFSKLVNGVWTEPQIAPFAKQFAFEPSVTPDNKRLYFQSGKAVAGALRMFTLYVERDGTGWGEVKDPGEIFNPDKTMRVTATLDGTLYTTDISNGGMFNVNGVTSGQGRECLAMMKKVNGEYQKLEQLGPPLNTGKRSMYPWIAPDERYMVFTVPRDGQNSESILYCSFRNKNGEWTEPKELKLGIDAGQSFVSFDGRYLFFTSVNQQGNGDIYWVDAKVIDKLQPEETK